MSIRNLIKQTPVLGSAAQYTWDMLFDRQKLRQFPLMKAFYRQFIQPGEMCFDIGANYGNRTEVFLKLGAKVVAVEPQPQCLEALRSRWGRHANLTILPTAMGSEAGSASMYLSPTHTLSSLSKEWIDQVKSSGRFADNQWDRQITVPVTTLDQLIAEHGMPAFTKIDVEGYELQVLQGLSQPVRALSIEFTPEGLATSVACIEHLKSLGNIELNYSTGEHMTLDLPAWVAPGQMIDHLTAKQSDHQTFGDIYIRFV